MLTEWQAEVLERLESLDEQKHFEFNDYSLRGLARLLLAKDSFVGFSTLMRFLMELKDFGVLKKTSSRIMDYNMVEFYVFNDKKAREFFWDRFGKSKVYELGVNRYDLVGDA